MVAWDTKGGFMEKKYLNVLEGTQLFSGMKIDEIEKMIHCLNPLLRKYEKNELITMEGDPFNYLGLVLTGKVSALKEKASGSRVIITMLHQGDMFGEMAAFSELKKWPVTVQCIENSVIL